MYVRLLQFIKKKNEKKEEMPLQDSHTDLWY